MKKNSLLAILLITTNLLIAQIFPKSTKTQIPTSNNTGIIKISEKPTIVSTAGTTMPTKTINIGNGRTITVTLKKNVNTGSEPAFNKIQKASLPEEKTPAVTCTSSKVVFTAESTTFMNGNTSNVIRLYPGAIYTFDDFFGGGFNEIIRGRNPIKIYTDQLVNPGGTSVITVNNPSGATINGSTGIGLIRNSISQGGGGTDLKYRSFSSTSESELSLKITAGGSYSGFSASAKFGITNVSNKMYLTIDVVKPMFTLKAERPSNGFFNDASIAATPNLLYVKEITYGTRILANIEIKLEKREDFLNFNAAYGKEGGVQFNLGGDFINKRTEASKTVNAYVIGGPDSLTTFNVDKLEEEIKRLLATCKFQHAKPIYYTMGDMNGYSVATQSATDEFVDKLCVPNNLVYKLTSAKLTIRTGADNKEFPSQVAMELYNRQTSGILYHQPFENNRIEFKINQDAAFGLDKHLHTNESDLTLQSISQSGLAMRIYYQPNWGTDAWKIEDVSIELEFKDQNGGPHPTLGRKRIQFANANGFLNAWDHVLTCWTDGELKATTSAISKQ